MWKSINQQIRIAERAMEIVLVEQRMQEILCRDPISTQESSSMTSIRDALDQLRDLYHVAKKRRKKKEGEVPHYQEPEEDGQLGPVHFL